MPKIWQSEKFCLPLQHQIKQKPNTAMETTAIVAFKAAKEIALTIKKGQMRRAKLGNETTNYCGANINGRMFVIGDTDADIQNPDAIIDGRPAREVFGDFTVMSK